LNRRTLIALSAAAAAHPAAAGSDPLDGITVVNALGGLSDPNVPEPPRPVLTPRILADARASGTTAVNVTVGYVAGSADPFPASVAEVAQWQRLIRDHPADLLHVLRAGDIARARRDGKIGVILGFQNAVQVADDPGRVDIFADLGVRIVQLTYNLATPLGDGAIATEGRGLTELGRRVVERLNANKIMVDLSHSGRQLCLDAVKVSGSPISINHTGCRALVDLPRNKTDEELRLVAERGGFVGIYFMPFLNLSGHAGSADVVAHIEHALNVCGEDHVGIGTDGGTTPIDDMEAYRDALRREHEDRKAKGVSAPGERADTHPFVLDLRGPDQFRKLYRLLAARGHKRSRIEKILGGNFVRYAEEVWGA
jgi:membrane dipeptidase